MRGLLIHARTGYCCTSTFSLRVLQYSTLGESERVLFLSQFFSVIIQILTSGIAGGIPQFRVLQEAAELKKLASLCDFDGEVWLPQMLRDRLVCGIGDSRMQRRLLAEQDLTFDKALQLVQAMESADQSASALTPDSGKADVNQVTYRKYRGGKPS